MKKFIIGENDAGQRVDKFLTKACPAMPKSALYKGIRTKNIKLNRKRCEIGTKLNTGDILEVYLPDDMLKAPDENTFRNIPPEIEIVYEDDNIIIINKPQGMVVHEDNDNTADTLANRLKSYLYHKGVYDPDNENSFAPALCNRIDRNTAGLVIAAKTAAALREMNLCIKERRVQKYYLCAAVGQMPKKSDVLTAYHLKEADNSTVRISDKPKEGYKEIKTGYRVIEDRGEYSVLEVRLYTGRTHQIRAHMAHIGHPLIGDGKYGSNKVNKQYNCGRQVLCAYKLIFEFDESSVLAYLNGKEFRLDTDISSLMNMGK